MEYLLGGVGIVFSTEDFFKFFEIQGCSLDCKFGDSCGSVLTGSFISISNTIFPFEITASNIVI